MEINNYFSKCSYATSVTKYRLRIIGCFCLHFAITDNNIICFEMKLWKELWTETLTKHQSMGWFSAQRTTGHTHVVWLPRPWVVYWGQKQVRISPQPRLGLYFRRPTIKQQPAISGRCIAEVLVISSRSNGFNFSIIASTKKVNYLHCSTLIYVTWLAV